MPPIKYHLGQFPPNNLDWERLIPLVGPANSALARYDGILSAIPNASVLVTPLTTQEAVLSSKIEGTQATMGEVLEYEAGVQAEGSQEKKDDIQEIINYRKAMQRTLRLLKRIPLSQRVIKDTHRVLLESGRGQNKNPGEYRREQNYIGPPGCTIDQARFIPIEAHLLPEAMSNWEKFIHTNYSDKLIQLAIVHAEFESLHPFKDGNGRLGRMIVPLFLFSKKLLKQPVFYISAYFERNRDQYYDMLLAVSRDNDWTGWCEYFLHSVIEQAEENGQKARDILELYEHKKRQIIDLTHSQYAVYTVDFMFCRPIFNSSDFTHTKEIPYDSARSILKKLKDNNLFHVIQKSGGRRPAVLAFRELINIVEGYKVFRV